MGFYRRVDVRMHGDARYLALSPPQSNGRSLFEWLIHGPFSNSIGLYQAGQMAMAESLEWSAKGFAHAFAEVIAQGLIVWCEDHRMIYLPSFLKHNPPGSTNVAKGWINLLDSLPECHLRGEWIQQFQAFAKAFPDAFKHGIPEGMSLAVRTRARASVSDSVSVSDSDTVSEKTLKVGPGPTSWVNGFDELWSLHPGPKGPEGEARKAYRQAKPPVEAVEAMREQLTYKADCDRRGVFCAQLPHLHRWIKKHRWKDEIPRLPDAAAPPPAPTIPDPKILWKSRDAYQQARKAGRVSPGERVPEWETSNTPST